MGPDFLCVGLQKAGTRWLHDQLRHTSGAWMPPIKEINYFYGNSFKPANIRDLKSLRKRYFNFTNKHRLLDRKFYSDFEQGMVPEKYGDDWYFSLFKNKRNYISGDISPAYSHLEDMQISRIAEILPNTSVLLLLRHPVDRVKSAISMSIRQKKLSEQDIQSVSGVSKILSKKTYEKHSFPSKIWQRWIKYFGEERCRFFFMEDINLKPEMVRKQAAEFVGIKSPNFGLPAGYNRKSKNRKYEFSDEVQSYLYEVFHEEILNCQKVFKGHTLDWRATV